MSSSSDRPDLDRLRELDQPGPDENTDLFDRMFSEVKKECDRSDRTVRGFVRSRSTRMRRLLVLATFAALGISGWLLFPLIDAQERSPAWLASLAAFAVFMMLSMLAATRPVHLPALPRWQVWLLVSAAVGATILAALWPLPATAMETHAHGSGFLAGLCMGVGLLLGIPVYALLRLVDRGNTLGSLIAAAAAGVAGNFVLKAHCPIPGTTHELLGHASVAVLFVAGLSVAHWLIPSKQTP